MRTITLRKTAAAIIAAASILTAAAQQPLCDKSRPDRPIDIELHALVGGTAQLQNYMGCFSEIRQLNTTMGCGAGAGAVAELAFRDFIALGTQINFLVYNNRTDMAVSNDQATSVSNVFIQNRLYYLNFPVYVSFRFNAAQNLKWNIDLGGYYSYGIGGFQKQTAYSSMINELGQLVNRVVTTRSHIFNNSETFLNEYYRGDLGIHLSTGLTFARHYHIGVTSDFGVRNISHRNGIVNPDIHNITVMFNAGYRF